VPDTVTVAARAADASLAAADADAAEPIVELLHTVEATVAVSSKVDNPHDYPEHLVDGKPETAWNSRTGDLHGFVTFRVPQSARVLRIELTAGYDKMGRDGDLFTMNHRIAKLRVSRAGDVLREVTLDPAVRGLQPIEVDVPGGDFRLDVLETLPGTKKEWRERVISELRVWGRAGGAPENPSHLPRMAIGSLDGVPPRPARAKGEPSAGPFPSIAAMCAAYDAVMTPVLDAAYPDDRFPGRIAPPHCMPAKASSTVRAPDDGGSLMLAYAGVVLLNDTERAGAHLVLRTARGYSFATMALWSRHHDDPGCLHATWDTVEDVHTSQMSTGPDVLVARVLHAERAWAQVEPTGNGDRYREEAFACSAASDGSAVCTGPVVTARASRPLPRDFDGTGAGLAFDPEKVAWDYRRAPTLGPAGDLRVADP
jgi:hypothetical protein